MKIDRIHISVTSSVRKYSAIIPLRSGANLLRAENTSGKSTLVQSIFFVLGLERAFGASVEIPLPYAMRERIEPAKDTDYEDVVSSFVELEVQNSEGKRVRLTRHVCGGPDPKLVQVRQLTEQGEGIARDYFLHDPGAAKNEAGFHRFLADFIGFDLPIVPTYDGKDTQLYLECLLPMFFIEQKRGWSVLQGPFPTHIRIQDMARRVMEFILNLDVGANRRKRADLRRLMGIEERSWDETYKELKTKISNLLRISGLPTKPNASFAASGAVEVEVFHEGAWITLADARRKLNDLATRLREKETKSVEAVSPELEARLSELIKMQERYDSLLLTLRNEYQTTLSEHRSVEARLSGLAADLQKNKDAEKLQKLGSELGRIVDLEQCPTCHQAVKGDLLPPSATPTMTINENIAFIRDQIRLYESLHEETEYRLKYIQTRYSGLDDQIREVRREIRSIRNDLNRSSSAVSRAEIEAVVRLEAKIANWDTSRDALQNLIDTLKGIAVRYTELENQLKETGSSRLSSSDTRKIDAIEKYMRKFLKDFHFTSFKHDEVTISRDTLRPQVYVKYNDGDLYEKDIGFDASASDAIRLKWAYYLAVLAVINEYGGNSFGFLVIDEPGQQAIASDDLIKFINLSGEISGGHSQIIIASSEKRERVEAGIDIRQINYLNFDSYIISPHTEQ